MTAFFFSPVCGFVQMFKDRQSLLNSFSAAPIFCGALGFARLFRDAASIQDFPNLVALSVCDSPPLIGCGGAHLRLRMGG